MAVSMDPAIIDFALWNATVHSPQDRLILLAVGRWRRVWKEVTPSVQYIADSVGISRRLAADVLKRLADDGMIEITKRKGADGGRQTNRYDIIPKGCIDRIPEEKRAVLSKLTGSTPPAQNVPPPHADPAPKTRTRENKKQEQLLNEIYRAYPRQIARGRAVEKIGVALGKITESGKTPDEAAAWLLAKTKEFAASPMGKCGIYTPYPSTWFHQQRYNDDTSEWQHGDADSKPDRPDETAWGEADEQFSGIKID